MEAFKVAVQNAKHWWNYTCVKNWFKSELLVIACAENSTDWKLFKQP